MTRNYIFRVLDDDNDHYGLVEVAADCDLGDQVRRTQAQYPGDQLWIIRGTELVYVEIDQEPEPVTKAGEEGVNG